MQYIRIPAVYEKLKKAEETYRPVLISAPCGQGKTAALMYYYRRKNPLVISCHSGSIRDFPDISSIRQSIVILDDLHLLHDVKSIEFLKELLRSPGLQIILVTRGDVPKYLSSEEASLSFMRIDERDLRFGKREIRRYFEQLEIAITEEDIGKVAAASRGYPIALQYYARYMEHGEPYSEAMMAAVWQDCFRFWDGTAYDEMEPAFRNFVLAVCRYEHFTAEMAAVLSGYADIRTIIEYCRSNTSQLDYLAAGEYRLREEMRHFFIWKQESLWSPEQIRENYQKAASYYEKKDDIASALRFYQKAGATENVKHILIRNAKNHPGTGHYIETKDYYFSLPDEEIKDTPSLMAGMSMLCDLLLLPEESEEWYDSLTEFAQDKRRARSQRREAESLIAYLDIALPHRGVKGILRIMRSILTMVTKGEIILPEMCATGNMPGIMNGGLDFSDWSKHDTQIAKFMKQPLEILLGKWGRGLVMISLAESGFEKGTMEPYEVLTRCNSGYEAASHGGRVEICFAAIGILIRQHITEGQLSYARRRMESFREMAAERSAGNLMPNLEAFSVWLKLLSGGERSGLDEYLAGTKDELTSFSILDRYRSMMRLRCLIAEERYEEALDLSTFLTGYLTRYERHYMWIENELLKSIVLFRLGMRQWKEHMREALRKASEYHFVRVVSLEGNAILPLLHIMEKDDIFRDIPEEYFQKTMEEAMRIALYYPDYLKYIPKEQVILTKREQQILSMLSSGMATEDICRECGISYAGLKKHNRNIYRKLGAKDRADAERKAEQLGLVHRRE